MIICVWLFVTLWSVAHQTPLPMGYFQARILEQVAISSSRGSSLPRDLTHVSCGSCIVGGFFICWAIRTSQSLQEPIFIHSSVCVTIIFIWLVYTYWIPTLHRHCAMCCYKIVSKSWKGPYHVQLNSTRQSIKAKATMAFPFCSGRTTLCLFRPFDLGLMNPPPVPRNDIFKLSPDHGRNGECLPPSDHSECPWLCRIHCGQSQLQLSLLLQLSEKQTLSPTWWDPGSVKNQSCGCQLLTMESTLSTVGRR